MASAEGARGGVTRAVPAGRHISGYAWGVIGASAIGLGTRVFLLGQQPLWRDEAFSAVAARMPPLEMLAAIRTDSAPPVGMLVVTLANLVSSDAVTLRLPSALAGAAAVPIGAAIGRRVGGPRAGLLAWRAAEAPSTTRLLSLSGAVTVALLTSYFTAFAIAGQMLAVAIALRPGWRPLLKTYAAAALGLLLAVPWLVYAAAQFQHVGTAFWVPPFDVYRLQDLWQEFIGGNAIAWGAPSGPLFNYSRRAAALAAAAGAMGLVGWAVAAAPAARRRLAYVVAAGVLPVLGLLLVSLQRPLFDERYASVLWIILVPALGVGFSAIWGLGRRVGAVAAGLLLCVMGAASVAMGPNINNTDVRPAVAVIDATAEPADFVAVSGPLEYFTLLYYARPEVGARAHVIAAAPRWFDGVALYRPDTFMTSVPADVPGRVLLLVGPGSPATMMPPGFHLAQRTCRVGYCVEGWSR